MTKQVTLESVIEQFRDALVDGWMFGDYHYGIPDVKVMLKLGFTPQSWTRSSHTYHSQEARQTRIQIIFSLR